MKFQGSNQVSLNCETNALSLHFLKPELHYKKTCVHKQSIYSYQENIEWSSSRVEQQSGTSHLLNILNSEFLGFQILVIEDL